MLCPSHRSARVPVRSNLKTGCASRVPDVIEHGVLAVGLHVGTHLRQPPRLFTRAAFLARVAPAVVVVKPDLTTAPRADQVSPIKLGQCHAHRNRPLLVSARAMSRLRLALSLSPSRPILLPSSV